MMNIEWWSCWISFTISF